MSICHVIPYDLAVESGGIKRHVLHLAAIQRLQGDRVHVVGPSSAPLHQAQVKGLRGVVNVPGNGGDNFIGLLCSPRKLWRYFARHRFDVLHLHEPQTPLLPYWAIWMNPRTAKVATFHSYSEKPAALRARQAVGAALFPFIQRGIAVSAAAARFAAPAWRRPLTVIPNGIDCGIFHPPGPSDVDVAAAAYSASRPCRLLFVGQLGDPRKGLRYLLDAYAQLLRAGVAVTLDVVGPLHKAPPLPALPGLKHWGALPVAELAARFRACDIFVAPSTGQESFGIVLLEAMASAKPVVCSSIDGYRGVIDAHGARFVEPGDAAQLAAALQQLLAAPAAERAAMAAHNLAKVAGYDWHHLVHALRGEYAAAVAGRRGPPASVS